jgi:hypothetical protein
MVIQHGCALVGAQESVLVTTETCVSSTPKYEKIHRATRLSVVILQLNRFPIQLREGVLFAEDKDLAFVGKVTFYQILVYKACHDTFNLTARWETRLINTSQKNKIQARKCKINTASRHLIYIHVDFKPFQSFYYDV